MRLLITLGIGCLIWPFCPEGLQPNAWHMFAIFVATIVGIILKPLPMGSLALISLTISVITQTITINQALHSFGEKVVWLVFVAFLLSRGFIKTGLGRRMAYYFMRYFGKTSLGIGYGLIFTEFLLAPFVPSNTARGAGIVYPIVRSVADSYDSRPEDQSERDLGSFLFKLCFQANLITSAMFLTAMAGNSLIVKLASELDVHISWSTWAKIAILPGLCNLLLLPLMLYKLYPPKIKLTPNAPKLAETELKKMGTMSYHEWVMLFTFLVMLFLWVFGHHFNLHATTAALFGLSILLLFEVLTWDDILSEKSAWNTFFWLATLLMMSSQLAQQGMIQWFSELIQTQVVHLNWVVALGFISLIYFYSHYLFASMTAHIASMYSAFLIVAITSGAPVLLTAMVFAFLSNLWGGLTHYGTGTAPVYFGSHYVAVKDWWRLGFVISVLNLSIWVMVGLPWWYCINLF